jgi:hypothetical protein
MSDELKEYELLRGEIAENSRLVATTFIANTTITSVLVGYGLSDRGSHGGAIFLAPLLILIPSLFFIASQLESTTNISQYLRVVLEPKLAVRWQTNWYELRKHGLLPQYQKYVPGVTGLYGALSIICLVLSFVTWNHAAWIYTTAAVGTMGPLVIAVFYIKRAFSMTYRESVADAWKQLVVQAQREAASSSARDLDSNQRPTVTST